MKTKNSFGIQFITRSNKGDEKNALIYARITVNKQRTEISIKRTIPTTAWHAENETVLAGESINRKEAAALNQYIEDVRYRLRECYQQLLLEDQSVNCETLKNEYFGIKKQEYTIRSLLEYHNVKMRGVLKPGTMKNYDTTERYILKFIEKEYRVSFYSVVAKNIFGFIYSDSC